MRGSDAAPGPNDPRVRGDDASGQREGDAALDGGLDASLADAAALPMMLEEGGVRAGHGGVGGVSGVGGLGGEGGEAAIGGTFTPR